MKTAEIVSTSPVWASKVAAERASVTSVLRITLLMSLFSGTNDLAVGDNAAKLNFETDT